MMADRVVKKRKPCATKTEQRDALLEVIFSHQVIMKNSCSFCEQTGASCSASVDDSSRCSECVRLNQSYCDARGLSPQQLRKVAAHHARFESELEEAENARRQMDAKIERLRKQKKLWFEKMMRAVSRGIDNVEELERVEKEEAEREAQRQAASSTVSEGRSSSDGVLPDDFLSTWDAVYSDVSLDPSVIATFGFVAPSGAAHETPSTDVARG